MRAFHSMAVGLTLAAAVLAQPQPRYTVTDLGTLGGTYSFAFGINSAGEVAGGAATPSQTDFVSTTAFLWTRQKGMMNLGSLGPPAFPSCPDCVSAAGAAGSGSEAAIGSEIATLDPNGEDFGQTGHHRITLAAVWRNGIMTALSNLPGGNNANVFWMNSKGEVSGVAETGVADATCSNVTPFQVRRFQAVVWGTNGEIERALSPLVSKGDTVSFAFTINDSGQVVGASGQCATTGLPPAAVNNTISTHAVMWDRDGTVTDLGNLGGASNIAGNINNRGEVVGTAQAPDGTIHAFRWTKQTGMQDYGAFPGAFATVPGCCHTLNERGEIVGFAILANGDQRALLWQDAQPKDLNDFVTAPSPFVQLLAANSINDAGEIIGMGVTETGEVHAFLAVPTKGAAARQEGSPRPLWMPEEVRRLLREGHGSGRFAARRIGPR